LIKIGTNSKKAISLILTALMCMSMYAMLAGVGVTANAAGNTYDYKVVLDVSDSDDNICINFSLFGKTNNGTGSEVQMGSTVEWDNKDTSKTQYTLWEGSSATGVFPTRIHIEDRNEPYYVLRTLKGNFYILVGNQKLSLTGTINSTSNCNTFEVGSGTDASIFFKAAVAGTKPKFNADYTVNSASYPYPSILTITREGVDNVTAPVTGSTSKATSGTITAVCQDQYGFNWNATSVKWSCDAIANTTAAMTSSTGLTSKLAIGAFTTNSTMKSTVVKAECTYGSHYVSDSMGFDVYPTYRITFDGNGITLPSSATKSATAVNKSTSRTDVTYTIPSNNLGLSRTGYDFLGWAPRTNQTAYSTTTIRATYDTDLVAVWSAYMYTVTFYGNGATSGKMDPQTFTYDTASALKENKFAKSALVKFDSAGGSVTPSRTATSTFLGWSQTANGSVEFSDKASIYNLTNIPNYPYYFYAVWQDGSIVLPSCTKENYRLEGWYTDSTYATKAGAAGDEYTPAGDITLVAKWVLDCQHPSYTSLVVDEPTCETAGRKVYTCTLCGDTYDEEIPALGHNYGSWTYNNASKTHEKTCKNDSSHKISAACTFTDSVTREATCSVQGIRKYTCTTCGGSYTTMIATTAHTPGEAVKKNEVAATCINEGSYDMVVSCTVCGARISSEAYTTEKVDHTPEAIPAVEGTCTREGFTAGTKCSVCKAVLEAPVSTGYGDHKPALTGKKAATCTEAGYTGDTICTICATVLETGSAIEKKAHTEVTAPGYASTCTTHGYTDSIICIDCNAVLVEREELPLAAHKAGAETRENEVAATCSAAGSYTRVVKCSVCETEMERAAVTVEKAAHTPGEAKKENVIPASCTREGSYDEVISCTVCGEVISRNNVKTGKTDHTAAAAKKENVVAATCVKEGSYNEVVRCAGCNTVLSSKAVKTGLGSHTPGAEERQNVTPATCSQEGSYIAVVKCTTCGKEISTDVKVIAKTSHHDGNSDGVCDDCGYDMAGNCSHSCHKGGFFWKIINFFNKLFKINKYCSCGKAHY